MNHITNERGDSYITKWQDIGTPSRFNERKQLLVHISKQGDVTIQIVAQKSFQHFMSAVLEKLTRGKFKDTFKTTKTTLEYKADKGIISKGTSLASAENELIENILTSQSWENSPLDLDALQKILSENVISPLNQGTLPIWGTVEKTKFAASLILPFTEDSQVAPKVIQKTDQTEAFQVKAEVPQVKDQRDEVVKFIELHSDKDLEKACQELGEAKQISWGSSYRATDERIERMASLSTAVRHLRLDHTTISDSGMKYLNRLEKLESLEIDYLSGISLQQLNKTLEALKKLRGLTLSYCEASISSNLLSVLKTVANNCQALTFLSLHQHDRINSQIKKEDLQTISTMGSLEELDLNGCTEFIGMDLYPLLNLPNLKRLDLPESWMRTEDDAAFVILKKLVEKGVIITCGRFGPKEWTNKQAELLQGIHRILEEDEIPAWWREAKKTENITT